jgi:hypothetical protein
MVAQAVSKDQAPVKNPHRGLSLSLVIYDNQYNNCANRHVTGAGVSLFSIGRPSRCTFFLRLFTSKAAEGRIRHKEINFGTLPRLSSGI